MTVGFTTQNFTIEDVNQPRLWIYLDDDPTQYTFVNGSTNTVFYNGAPSPDVQWVSPTSFRFNNLSNGLHTFRLALVNAVGTPYTNGEAGTARAFTVGVPFPSAPSIIMAGPAPNADVPGPVLVSFVIANHVSGLNGQPHMHFYIDGSTERHEYFNGAGITEDNGVQLNGAHTHAVHWKSPTSFMMYGWSPGPHSVRLVLADAAHNELANPEATQTLTFNITSNAGTSEFELDTVVPNVNVRAIAFAPDGRAFYAEGHGQVWIAQTAGGTWQQNPTPFYQTTVGQLGEQGLTGVVVDPNYAANGFVYIYYTTPDQQFNRLVRVTDVNGQATQETIIMDNLLAADQHNGGVLKFGPDGKFYVSVGEATQDFLAQDLTSRHGKILRINGDGTFPPDNPFPTQGPAVWAYGIRNSFGMAFHPITNDLWITDNGPTVDDEVDLIVKGGNYGWPIATGTGTGPSGTLLPAAYVLSQPVGITNIVALTATSVYPTEYHNNLFFSDYVEGKIRRLVLDPTFKTVVSDSAVFDGGNGGLIALTQAPDGYMYVSGADGISRVVLNPNTHH
ncbi:hypothetical protein YTPLAS18_39070 [Nitrospira sp.]|nr:hypothetical protein YTPLAS18_39070 [Nitrospira sp.]